MAGRKENTSVTWDIQSKRTQKYANYIFREILEISFEETVIILKKIFGEKSSLFNTRWQCLNLTKSGEGYSTLGGGCL